LKTAHAFAWLESALSDAGAGARSGDKPLSGRGDKDVTTVAERLGDAMAGERNGGELAARAVAGQAVMRRPTQMRSDRQRRLPGQGC